MNKTKIHVIFYFLLWSFLLAMPEVGMAIQNGKFEPCTWAPRCVSTQETGRKYVEPLPYQENLAVIREKTLDVIRGMKRTKILRAENNYIHAQFTTRLLRFKDDVEVYFDDENKIIHFKSSSRIGFYDGRTNKNRINRLKDALKN